MREKEGGGGEVPWKEHWKEWMLLKRVCLCIHAQEEICIGGYQVDVPGGIIISR